MPMDVIPGFAPGIVTDNADPRGTGRIKARIPGVLDETPYWVMPGCWPGAGRGDRQGSQYPPPPVGGQVGLLFEYGQYLDPNSHAFYFTGYYGHTEDGIQAGPEIISAALTPAAALKRVVFWEGRNLLAYMVEDDDEERLVLQAKTSGSKIEINAKDGATGTAETVKIEARTGISIYARGNIDINSDAQVRIQNRTVNDHRSGDI